MLGGALIELEKGGRLRPPRRHVERRVLIAEQLVDDRAAGVRILEIKLPPLADLFRRTEEEELFLHDRSAARQGGVVAAQRQRFRPRRIEGIRCIDRVVAEESRSEAAEGVAAALG